MKSFMFIVLLAIGGCTTVKQNNGAEIRQVKLDQVTPKSTKNDVQTLMGSPSTKSMYGPETWYYITSKIKKQLISDDKILTQNVVAISFTQAGTVETVEIYDANSRHEFATSDRITPTAGRKLSVVEQNLGNVGKFNTDSTGSSTIGSHAPGGAGH